MFFLGGFLIGSNCKMILDWSGRRVWPLLGAAVVLFGAKMVLLVSALAADSATGEALAAGGLGANGPCAGQCKIYSPSSRPQLHGLGVWLHWGWLSAL